MKFGRRELLMGMIVAHGVSGCTYNKFTNLTPTQLPREGTGNYPVEMSWDSNNRTIVEDTVKAYVMVDQEFYPMTNTQVVKDRWEAMIPVDAGVRYVNYRFKVDYKYKSMPNLKANSDLSDPYLLKIEGKTQEIPLESLVTE